MAFAFSIERPFRPRPPWYVPNVTLSTKLADVMLLFADPPWRSKSVRRSAHYEEMDMYDLYKIALPDLLRESAKQFPVLIGVWVTNHTKCRRFVSDKLLPSWGVSNIVNWYWVKITAGEEGKGAETGGLPVWSYDGPSPRRSYEGLMLGYYNPGDLDIRKVLPDKRAFLSVPLEHSRKPLVTGGCSAWLERKGRSKRNLAEHSLWHTSQTFSRHTCMDKRRTCSSSLRDIPPLEGSGVVNTACG